MASNSENPTSATEISTGITCVSCNTACSPGQKFCLNCGEGLWFSCPECEEDTPVNSGFCGSCGHDLRSIFKEGDELFGQSVEEAKAKAAALDLNAAIRILLSACESPKIHRKAQKQQLMDLVGTYRKQKTEYKSDAEDRFQKAKLLFDKSNFSDAHKIVSEIPEALRSAEAEELLQTLQEHMSESKRLSAELESLIQKKDLLGALPVIKSLLTYRPEDEKLKKLASDIVKRVIATVEKYKQAGKFKEAFTLIRRIGEMGSSTKTQALSDELKEIVWLTNYVKKVQTVDTALIIALQHLASIVPSDENKKLFAEAKKRFATSKPDQPASWSPAPKVSSLGAPVSIADHGNIVQGFESINVDGHCHTSFRVAAGLAIQGLGKAAIQSDLSGKKSGFLGLGGKKTGKVAWGLDFGDSSLKAVKLSVDAQGGLKLEQADRLTYRHTDTSATSNEHRSNMLEALLRLKSKFDLKKEELCVINLSPGSVLARYLMLPNSDPKALKAAMEFEVKLQIPFPLDEVTWDSCIFPSAIKDKKFAVVAAARKTDATLVADMFSANGMKTASIQPESLALYNFGMLAQENGTSSCDAYIDIGHSSSTMTFVSPSRVWFRSFGVGTEQFNKSLCRKLRINSIQASAILNDFSKADTDIAKALMALQDPYRDLVAEVNRSIQGFQTDMRADFPDQIFLVGGGAHLHGMTTYLRHEFNSLTVE